MEATRRIDYIINEFQLKSGSDKWSEIDFLFLLVLQRLRFEIDSQGKVEDSTAAAIKQLVIFQIGLYRDHQEISEGLQRLLVELYPYNDRLANFTLNGLGASIENWKDYMEKIFSKMMRS